MPTFHEDGDLDRKAKRLREARRQVREKFPRLIEDSSGWHRAVAARLRKVKIP